MLSKFSKQKASISNWQTSNTYCSINCRGVFRTIGNILNESWLQRRIQSSVKYLRWSFFRKFIPTAEANPEFHQKSKMQLLVKIIEK